VFKTCGLQITEEEEDDDDVCLVLSAPVFQAHRLTGYVVSLVRLSAWPRKYIIPLVSMYTKDCKQIFLLSYFYKHN